MRPVFAEFRALACAAACGAALAAVPSPGHAGAYAQLYAFQGVTDGSLPAAGLIDVGGLLYGTATYGGPGGAGTVFALNPATSAIQIVHAFADNGSDGSFPNASLTQIGATLYGTTSEGGAGENGTVYALNPATGAEQILVDFSQARQGASPRAGLNLLRGKLFGALAYQGAANAGAVFSLNPNTGAEKDIYQFQGGSDGVYPFSTLVATGFTLYGTTYFGGSANKGTVFTINAKTNAETVLYAFQGGNDGAIPLGGLLYAGGMLYGTTQTGGPSNNGTVFAINPATGAETILYAFQGGVDGANPSATLIKYAGRLYGTTTHGGKSTACGQGCGTIFAVDPGTAHESIVYSFRGHSDGAAPQAGLLAIGGILYGATAMGGSTKCSNGCGTVFSYTP